MRMRPLAAKNDSTLSLKGPLNVISNLAIMVVGKGIVEFFHLVNIANNCGEAVFPCSPMGKNIMVAHMLMLIDLMHRVCRHLVTTMYSSVFKFRMILCM